jgi:glucose/arabinose dehydrogenase
MMKTTVLPKYIWINCLIVLLSLVITFSTFNPSALSQATDGQITWPKVTLEAWPLSFDRPVAITHAGDQSGRVFVVEQRGTIRIVQEGQLNPEPFLDLSAQVQCCGEEGLLGLAFPPNYTEKGHFYIYYTRQDGNNQVSRYRVSPDPDIADPNSEEEILFLHHPTYANHNGGKLAFGPDGYLYIGTGDGGGAGDPQNNAQNLASLMGKILRIDAEGAHLAIKNLSNPLFFPLLSGGTGSSEGAYAIPSDNPFLNDPQARPEIWAFGLRNPWRFSFDAETGDLYIADVGQQAMEEINFQPASSSGGENYGWNILEGNLCFSPSNACTPPPHYSPPVSVYEHSQGCSVTGGEVYRGTTYPLLEGIYLYGDYCSGRIWGLVQDGSVWQSRELLDTSYRISTFGSDEMGDLYLADLNNGTIYRIIASP